MIYAKEKSTGKILASNSHCTAESMLSDITSDGTKAEDVVVAEASEEQIRTWITEQREAAETYADKRKAEYPTIAELVVALYDTDDKAAIEQRRADVKKKYPKPE